MFTLLQPVLYPNQATKTLKYDATRADDQKREVRLSAEEATEILEKGCYDIIQKPFDLGGGSLKIREVFG